MMLKRISAVLVLSVVTASPVMAQAPTVPAATIAKTWIAPSKLLLTEHREVFGAAPMRLRTADATKGAPRAQDPAERSWAARHPVALGAMIGAAAGAVLGYSPCWKEVCGDGHGQLLMAFGAGVGAGIGAGAGLTVSLVRH